MLHHNITVKHMFVAIFMACYCDVKIALKKSVHQCFYHPLLPRNFLQMIKSDFDSSFIDLWCPCLQAFGGPPSANKAVVLINQSRAIKL